MKSRRGLSTVIGAMFFVIAATTVITYISYSMNLIDEFAQSVIVSEAENINRVMEKITISQASIVGGEFNATIVNTGSLPAKLTRLWVVDNDSGLNSKANLDIMINPGNQDYVDSTGITVDSVTDYTLKVVTSRGNIATFSVSPDTSTQIQIIVPAEVSPSEVFTVVSTITNNSTLPNNIANLVPTITNNATLTQVAAITPTSIAVLPQGNTATFTSSWNAPATVGPIIFNASYAGAPQGSWTAANVTVAISAEAEEATQSQWSQAASRVGILISGIPNPINSAAATQYGNWGIGIINPLDRDVEVYAVGIMSGTVGLVDSINGTGTEPSTGWRTQDVGNGDMVIWEADDTPVIIGEQSVGQFRVQIDYRLANQVTESLMTIQALTSEGKLSAFYTASTHEDHPMINAFYTNDTSNPTSNWTYTMPGIPGGKDDQVFNATVYNSSSLPLSSKVKLLILIPNDFTDVKEYGSNSAWGTSEITENPDGSHVIKVSTVSSTMFGGVNRIFQFSADPPVVTTDKLYVLQTTTIYPTFSAGNHLELASALSEAGMEVIP